MPAPIPPPRESGTVPGADGVPLYWAAWGPAGAPRVLVLHGGPGAHHDYLLPQLLRVAEGRDAVFYDQRGGGRSRTDDPTPVTWRTQVDDLRAVADALVPDGPLHLVGYSWGALLALLFALEGGRAPSSLTLIDPAPLSRAYRQTFEAEFARRSQSPAIQAMRAELQASGLRERDPDAHRQRAFELSVAGYFHDPERARDLTPFRVTGRVQQSVWDSLGDFDLVPRLGAVACPTLIVHARQDPIPLASSEAAAAAMPNARLVVIEDSGHVPYVEQPEALFAAVLPFLDEQR
ncbi:alpha/beta fold hydrolase [Roseisolibacter sp. H3M3-2]|uniref:alpha/beta fold hydrolase n=1 Tax=Roseisolibacter sp. H3M3-2 TaxID=3031323 RepID=UPI0023D9E060|nr:alpha/beta fold hydrolase [Roseisolibacter sp. H3M3-2]MDF1504272.1 alpha/beta fold hydrolase [Roseisolibacter sp. H3M3-2]